MSEALVYIVSDSIGETARQVVKAAATQFNSATAVKLKRFSYITEESDLVNIISEAAEDNNSIIAFTLVNPQLRGFIKKQAQQAEVKYVDIMGPMLDALEGALDKTPKLQPGLVRQLDEEYFERIDAIEFTVKYDDRNDIEGIKQADVVLVGVSRTSKTPMSIYLSYRGYKVANVPLVPEIDPPDILFDNPGQKLIGLTIDPESLIEIRAERLKTLGLKSKSNYASVKRIIDELDYADQIFAKIGCPVVDVSNKSVEESANYVLKLLEE
ncbi:MAG: pyruvate, water dikinase regulatory protein [Bacillota bacterium]